MALSRTLGSNSSLVDPTVKSRAPNGRVNRAMLSIGFASMGTALLAALAPAFPPARSFSTSWRFEWLWQQNGWQQVSGYMLLAICGLSLAALLAKRLFPNGSCPAKWRMRHASLGLLGVLAFLSHTGLSLGVNLNRMLAWNFIALVLIGGIAVLLRRGKKANLEKMPWPLFVHLLLFWSLLVLTFFHVFAVYYF